MIAATIIPDTATVIQAAREAERQGCGLYITPDGHTVVAPQPLPGWFRIAVRDAYEETDRTAGCCDIDRIGGVAA
jgi:hypothetical protein